MKFPERVATVVLLAAAGISLSVGSASGGPIGNRARSGYYYQPPHQQQQGQQWYGQQQQYGYEEREQQQQEQNQPEENAGVDENDENPLPPRKNTEATAPTTHSMKPPSMRLCVLQSSNEGSVYEEDDVPRDVGSHILRAGFGDKEIEVENVLLEPKTYASTLMKLAKRFEDKEIDCFINLCDGAWDEPSCGIEVVDLLENKLNLPYTGADMGLYEPTRLQMKKAALSCGVKVPAWRFLHSQNDLESFLAEFETAASEDEYPMRFPLLPKHFSSYSSVGLTKESKVSNVRDLRLQCQRMLDKYGGSLVEEFIEGREFTVLAAQKPLENDEGVQVVALDPVECHFSEGEDFKHYNLKWIDYEDISWHPVQEADLAERLKKLAVDVFRSIKGRGYGRMDVRSDSKGDLYFLEVNPNCGLFYPQGMYGSTDFILDRIDPKHAHANFILNQVEVARALWKEKNQAKNVFEVRYNPKQESWGLLALQDIKEGELIQEYEESAFHLVSRAQVLKHWKGVPVKMVNGWGTERMDVTKSGNNFDISRNWDNFAAYCWPVSDNLFAMWDPNPENWKPINHHCDPNAWYEEGNGLNMVARRLIRRGEEICMDYATFVGYFPEMHSFQCSCGASQCRGEITGMDIVRHPELAQRYRGHLSDYVASKIGVLGDHAPQN